MSHYNNTCPGCGEKSTCRCPSKNKVETTNLCWNCQNKSPKKEASKKGENLGSKDVDMKKVHDLLFYSRRSTPKILHPEEVDGFRSPENYGTLTLRRKATDEEEAEISKGRWLRVDENGNRPGSPDYKRTSLRPALLRAKRYSDVGRYGPKNSILNKLLFEYPEEFYIDSKHMDKFPGLTHGPTGFRIHAPRQVALKARGQAPEADRLIDVAEDRDVWETGKRASQQPPRTFQEFIDGIYKPRTTSQDATDFVRAGLGFYGIGKGMQYGLPKVTGAVLPEGRKPGIINSIRYKSKDIPGYIRENPKTFGKGVLGLLAASLLGYDFQNTMRRITHRGFLGND